MASVSKSDDLFERAVLSVVSRVSGRTVAGLALLLYPGVGLILPLALTGRSRPWSQPTFSVLFTQPW